MNLDIEKFNPKKVELIKKVEKYKNLKINGIEDKVGYQLVDTARKDLKATRGQITKAGKELRDEAVKFSKVVIAREKEFVAIIEPLEKELKEKTDTIDLIIEKEKRKTLLPERIAKLKEINVEVSDDELLEMDSKDYLIFFNEKKEEYLEEEARKIEEEKNRIRENKRLEEIKKEAADKAKKEAEEEAEAKRKADAEKIKLEREKLEFEKQKAENDKQKAEEEVKRIRKEVKDKLDREAREKLEAIEKQKVEEKKLNKLKEYKKFLKDNEWTEETSEDFKIVNTEDRVVLFKKVGVFNK